MMALIQAILFGIIAGSILGILIGLIFLWLSSRKIKKGVNLNGNKKETYPSVGIAGLGGKDTGASGGTDSEPIYRSIPEDRGVGDTIIDGRLQRIPERSSPVPPVSPRSIGIDSDDSSESSETVKLDRPEPI